MNSKNICRHKGLVFTLGCLFFLFSGCSQNAEYNKERVWKPDYTSEFEIGTQIRPWTIADEGMDYILDNMQSMIGVNNLYMVAVMHSEYRPFKATEFPHNPARDSFEAEDSRVSFFPEWERYGKIKPILSDYEWIRETDWLQLMIDSCRARGLTVGAEVSHYPIPTQIVRENPDLQQKTINGEAWSAIRFCPNNPDVREYIVALYGDLAANYDLDYIQTCQVLFNGFDIDEGGSCFCPHCIEAAKEAGFDLEAAIPVLMKDKNAQPERDNWIKFRINSTTEFYHLIAETIKKENPDCEFRLNEIYGWHDGDPIKYGLDLEAIASDLGSVVHQDHQEQVGNEEDTFENRKQWIMRNREKLGPDMHLVTGIGARMDASPPLIKKGIKAALDSPARINGVVLKHYDGASFSLMRAFKQGIIDAGVKGLTPCIGKEAEEMTLENYRQFPEELAEEWGIETKGTGVAKYTFEEKSGVYDVRITYFDEIGGQSEVSLLINDEQVAGFKLDEDTDCWRWRRFNNIRVKRGDEIKLVGIANSNEKAKLDFIEFIPCNTSNL